MAGSYGHCREDDGTFRFDLIENMGDANEACHEMFHMLQLLGTDEQIEEVDKRYHALCRLSWGDYRMDRRAFQELFEKTRRAWIVDSHKQSSIEVFQWCRELVGELQTQMLRQEQELKDRIRKLEEKVDRVIDHE